MCGLVGWIGLKVNGFDATALNKMIETIRHRGPDDTGHYRSSTKDGRYEINLGFARLSIIDARGGSQPMISSDHRYVLTFNGEIYNYVELRRELRERGVEFRTSSDTEVLLNAWTVWGVRCLDRLRGMFALAMWDAEREVLHLARDRFGKKPLFFRRTPSGLIFASEIKAILTVVGAEVELDKRSVLDFFQYLYVPAPATMFADISKLMPGTHATWEGGNFLETSYWRPPDGQNPSPQAEVARPGATHERNIVGQFSSLFEESVQVRMRSDVPFGAFLSGGVDSSAVVAMMSKSSNKPIETYSVGFDEAAFDESGYAREVAEAFSTNHHVWQMRASDVPKLLTVATHHHDSPVGDPNAIATLELARLAARDVRMVLTGEGADEVLGGYPKHNYDRFAPIYQTIVPSFVHNRLIEPLVDALPPRLSRRARTLAYCSGLRDPAERFPRWFGALDKRQRDALIEIDVVPREVGSFMHPGLADLSGFRRILYFDQTSWLPDYVLERNDRMTMAASIEARMPFLDHNLAAFLSTLPDKFRIRRGILKWILRTAMQGILPDRILTRPKIGFRVPTQVWFRTELKDYLHEMLLGPRSGAAAYCRSEELERLIREHTSGKAHHEKLLWALLSFEVFRQEYNFGI